MSNAKQIGEVIKEPRKRKGMTKEEELANETVDELKEQEKLIKAVNAELEEWLCSGDTDYLYKAMAVIRAEIDNELQHEIDKLIAEREG